MTELNVSSLLPAASVAPKPGKIKDAAQQFEALLIGQILRTERESGGGWLGGGSPSSDCAVEFAEQHFATVLAQQGGLGLAKLIGKGPRDRIAAVYPGAGPATRWSRSSAFCAPAGVSSCLNIRYRSRPAPSSSRERAAMASTSASVYSGLRRR